MRKIIFIGTLHAGLTPKNELGKILDSLKPDQLFIEIPPEAVDNKRIFAYPDEMIFALRWAKRNRILVSGFDANIEIIKKGKTEKDSRAVLRKQKMIIKKYGWRNFNRERFSELLDKEAKDLIDLRKWRLREEKMAKNIAAELIKSGTIIILTGVSHLSFFEKKFRRAEFSFRRH
jgi:hypothetical protein